MLLLCSLAGSAAAWDLVDVNLDHDGDGNVVLSWGVSAPIDYVIEIQEGWYNDGWDYETNTYFNRWEWNPIDHISHGDGDWPTSWVDWQYREAYKVLLYSEPDSYCVRTVVVESGPLYP